MSKSKQHHRVTQAPRRRSQSLSLKTLDNRSRFIDDLPSTIPHFFFRVSDPFAVIDRRILERIRRQVRDLPRIGVAEPERKGLVQLMVLRTCSKTCRASEWQSQSRTDLSLAPVSRFSGMTCRLFAESKPGRKLRGRRGGSFLVHRFGD